MGNTISNSPPPGAPAAPTSGQPADPAKPPAAPANTPAAAPQESWIAQAYGKFANNVLVRKNWEIADAMAQSAKAKGLTALVPLPAAAPKTLQRPVVMIPGFSMDASSYDRMAQYLSKNPANGQAAVYVAADQQFHRGSASGEVMSPADVASAKIFEVQFSDPFSGSAAKGDEITAAMDAIQQAKGGSSLDVDVVAHSAGCTNFRNYLDTRSDAEKAKIHVQHAVLIGPASHGTLMGDAGAVGGGVLGPEVKAAAAELEPSSPLVKGLNQRWDDQKKQVSGGFSIIGVEARDLGRVLPNTPDWGKHKLAPGDGFMPVDQLAMPGARLSVLDAADPTVLDHLAQVGYPGVIGQTVKALGVYPG